MLNEQIRELRNIRGISQIQLANKLGVTKQSVSNWENDNILPSIEMLVKIANFLKFQPIIFWVLIKNELWMLKI